MQLRIRELREREGFSQAHLSKLSGVSQGKISEYETGKSIPRLDSARRIAGALKVRIEELFREAV